MPELHRMPRGQEWTLSNAHETGQLVHVKCQFCRVMRHYLPAELRTLIGDVPADLVPAKMRCERCGRKDYLMAAFVHLTARERQSIRLRRLVGITTIKRPRWRDEKGA